MIETLFLFREAFVGSLLIALACSVLGVFVVLRRIVFVGAALAQISSAGLALAFFLLGRGIAVEFTEHPEAFSLVITLASVAFFASTGRGRVAPDAKIGVAYAIAAATGILLIAKASVAEMHDIFLQGNILGITRGDMLELFLITVPVLAVHGTFSKEFLFVSFDRETARTLGYRVERWDLALYLSLGLVISIAMQYAGVMLVFNFLVLPAVTGLLLARGVGRMVYTSAAAGVVAAALGFAVSIPYDLPTGPTMIAVSGVLVVLAWVVRRYLLHWR